MTLHSKIGASSAKRWMACPGSVRLSAGIESRSSDFAKEGTMAHALAETCITDGIPASASIGHEFSYEDHGQLEVGVVSDNMAEAVDLYVEWVRDNLQPGDELLLEHKFHLAKIHDDLFGTSDCVIWKPTSKTLIVADYKHGQGVGVEVDDNPQLPYYALGALLETGYPADTIQMVIVQPRCPHPDGPVRSKTFPAIDLLDFADDLQKAALATEAEDAPLCPGDYCRWCPAAGLPCPAIAAKAQSVAKEEFRADLTYDADKLAETLRWLPILEGWCASVREFAYGEAERGRTPPGFKLVEKRATRRWKDASAIPQHLIELNLDEDQIFEKKLITPAAAEKLLGKEQRAELEALCIKESSGLALAPNEDRRPAVKLDAKTEFSAA